MSRILARTPEAEWPVERRVLTTIQTFPQPPALKRAAAILYRGAVWGGIAAGVLLLAQGRF